MQRNVTKDNPWQTTCRPAPCADDRVKLSVQAKTGRAVLKRGLLKVTYEPAKVRTTRSGRKHVVKSWGRVDIECGHPKMESVESYPQVLCGSPENTAADVSSFRKTIEVELKKDLPDTFGYIPQWAFDSARLSDHAVLRRQSVPQQDSLCQEASDIVSGTCPAVAEKMYNCSNMYDPHQFDFSSYVTCVDDVMHPMKLYVSCLRALCERCEDSLHDTCTTLRTASQLCDPRMGLAGVGVRDPRVMLAADLVVRAKCPQVKP
ncbi:hypothetical protein V1264_005141 [Littorina saxatilis]|uniref:Uncharacterized protein n=2 Tax=Littorina saxatilis TaxID=31220 RepID=A0AAN9AYJ2_9CAEN